MTRLLYIIQNWNFQNFSFVHCFSFPVKKQNKVFETRSRSQIKPKCKMGLPNFREICFVYPSQWINTTNQFKFFDFSLITCWTMSSQWQCTTIRMVYKFPTLVEDRNIKHRSEIIKVFLHLSFPVKKWRKDFFPKVAT